MILYEFCKKQLRNGVIYDKLLSMRIFLSELFKEITVGMHYADKHQLITFGLWGASLLARWGESPNTKWQWKPYCAIALTVLMKAGVFNPYADGGEYKMMQKKLGNY